MMTDLSWFSLLRQRERGAAGGQSALVVIC